MSSPHHRSSRAVSVGADIQLRAPSAAGKVVVRGEVVEGDLGMAVGDVGVPQQVEHVEHVAIGA